MRTQEQGSGGAGRLSQTFVFHTIALLLKPLPALGVHLLSLTDVQRTCDGASPPPRLLYGVRSVLSAAPICLPSQSLTNPVLSTGLQLWTLKETDKEGHFPYTSKVTLRRVTGNAQL